MSRQVNSSKIERLGASIHNSSQLVNLRRVLFVVHDGAKFMQFLFLVFDLISALNVAIAHQKTNVHIRTGASLLSAIL